MGWAAAAIGGASLVGGVISADAAGSAADVQAQATRESAKVQKEMYDLTRKDLSPFVRMGTGGMNYLNSLIPGGLKLTQAQAGQVQDDPDNPKTIAGPDGIQIPNPNYDPNKPNPNAEKPFELDGPGGQSPFLTSLQSLTPGGGSAAENALTNLAPGGNSPLLSAVNSFVPGSGVEANPFLKNVQNFIPGASATPDESLTSLRSFTIGGQTENPLVKQMNALLGLGPSKEQQEGQVKELFSRWERELKASGKSQEEFLASPEGQAFVTERNNVISGLTDPHQLAKFQNGAPDAAANATARLEQLKTDPTGGQGKKIQEALEATPGYKFIRDQGLKSTQNSFAAKGLGNSGAALRGAAEFTTGLADSTYEKRLADYMNAYNNQFTNSLNSYNNQFTNGLNAYNTGFTNTSNAYGQQFTNALNNYNTKFTNAYNAYGQQTGIAQNIVNTGQNAAAQTGTIGQATGQAIGNTLVQGGAAQAAGIVGSANAVANSLTGLGNTVGTAMILQNPGVMAGINGLTGNNAAPKTGMYK